MDKKEEAEVVFSETIEPGDYIPRDDVVEFVKDMLIKMEGLQNMIRDGKEVFAHNKAQGIKDKLTRLLMRLSPARPIENEDNKNS